MQNGDCPHFFCRGEHHLVAVQTLLAFWRTLEFPEMAVDALGNRRTVRGAGHVFMSGPAVTVDAFQAFLIVKAVVKVQDFLFDFIANVKDILMAVQTPFGGQVVIGKILRRNKLVTNVLSEV